jgi:hypothetical protein
MMSEIQEIDVRIDRNGKVEIEVRGVTGKNCEALTRDLEQMLGGVVTERVHRDSYHQEEVSESQSDWQSQGW